MAALISKLRVVVSSAQPPPSPPPLRDNPIKNFFEVRGEVGSGGAENMWRIFDAYRISDDKECSVFVFDKRNPDRWFKPKRKEQLLEGMRDSVRYLDRVRHPCMLQVIHPVEEDDYTIAFASEAIFGSLADILAWHESKMPEEGEHPVVNAQPATLGPAGSREPTAAAASVASARPKEYHFLDFELRYGLFQMIEALSFLHYKAHRVHRNVCPNVILICKRGTWKLFGLEFYANVVSEDPSEFISVSPWSPKVARISQPNLDYIAPEVQFTGRCNMLSDMFSLGLVMSALYNKGRPLIRAGNNPQLYTRQMEQLDRRVAELKIRVPVSMQEVLKRMLCRDPNPRPTTQLLPLLKYFKGNTEKAILALQYLDAITMKAPDNKAIFYRTTLIEALPHIPEKLRWQHVWPWLQMEVRISEVLPAVVDPIIWLSEDSTNEDFTHYILPTIKSMLATQRSIGAMTTLLHNMQMIMAKAPEEDVGCDLLPLLYISCDSVTQAVQVAALIALRHVSDHINDDCLAVIVLPKIELLFEKNMEDYKVISLIIGFYEKVLRRLERNQIHETLLPTLLKIRSTEPTVLMRVIKLYKSMFVDPKFGVNTEVMAIQLIPHLAPYTVQADLTMEAFTYIMESIHEMLDGIEKCQRHKLKLEALAKASPERKRLLFNKMSSDNVDAPPFTIPNLRVDKRKTSSAEDMIRKNSAPGPSTAASAASAASTAAGGFRSSANIIGQWFFGSNNSTNNASDKNYLRVSSVLPNRRLSDQTLVTPKIRVAPSCASSPGGTPGGSAGLPVRRHSSIGPQERRGSSANLSPSTANRTRPAPGGSGSSLSVPSTSKRVLQRDKKTNTSSSVPFLTSSLHSVRSRRPSTAHSSQQGLLQQLGLGTARSSSGGRRTANPHWSTLHSATASGYNELLRRSTAAMNDIPSLQLPFIG